MYILEWKKWRVGVDRLFYLFWILFCTLVLWIFIKNGWVRFRENDDVFIGLIASGAYGKQYPYVFLMNIGMGHLLMFLNNVAPHHNWMMLVSLMTICVGDIWIGWLLFWIKKWRGAVAAFFFVAITSVPLINRMNFSNTGVTAFGAGLLGYLLLVNANKRKCHVYFIHVICVILMIWGCLFRKETMLLFVSYILVCVLVCIKKTGNTRKKKIRELFKWVVPLVIVFGFWMWDSVAYGSNPEWNQYQKYSSARAKLVDYGVPDYETNSAAFEAIGISEGDLNIIKNYIYADDTLFSEDSINSIIAIRNMEEGHRVDFVDVLNRIRSLFGYSILTITVVFWGWTVAFSSNKRELLYVAALFLLQIFYILYQGRILERSVLPECVCLYIVAAGLGDLHGFSKFLKPCRDFKVNRFTCALLSATVFSIVISNTGITPHNESRKKEADTLLEVLTSRDDCLYAWDIFAQIELLCGYYSPFDYVEKGALSNSVLLGGWPAQSPYMTERIGEFGDPYNLIKDLAENKNVYLVDYQGHVQSMVTEYIKEHYDASVSCNEVERIGDFVISEFSTGARNEAQDF